MLLRVFGLVSLGEELVALPYSREQPANRIFRRFIAACYSSFSLRFCFMTNANMLSARVWE